VFFAFPHTPQLKISPAHPFSASAASASLPCGHGVYPGFFEGRSNALVKKEKPTPKKISTPNPAPQGSSGDTRNTRYEFSPTKN